MISNTLELVSASYYLNLIMKRVPELYRYNINYDSIDGDNVLSGAGSRNILEVILKVGMAIMKFPTLNEEGKLSFISKEEALSIIDSEFFLSDLKIESLVQSLPKVVTIYTKSGTDPSSFAHAALRTEITNKTFNYYGSAFGPYPIWEPEAEQYYKDIIVEIDGYPAETPVLFANDDDGILKMNRGTEISEEITARVKGYKLLLGTASGSFTTKGQAPYLTINNFCIPGASVGLMEVLNWMKDNYSLYRTCSMRLAADARVKTARRFEAQTNINNAVFEGLVTRQRFDFSGSFRSEFEGMGRQKP